MAADILGHANAGLERSPANSADAMTSPAGIAPETAPAPTLNIRPP
ncbi:MAG: hypothetical protein R3C20_02700 [Planctomycetaceae bacterium]